MLGAYCLVLGYFCAGLVVEFSCFSVCGVVEVAVLTVTVTSEAQRPGVRPRLTDGREKST